MRRRAGVTDCDARRRAAGRARRAIASSGTSAARARGGTAPRDERTRQQSSGVIDQSIAATSRVDGQTAEPAGDATRGSGARSHTGGAHATRNQ